MGKDYKRLNVDLTKVGFNDNFRSLTSPSPPPPRVSLKRCSRSLPMGALFGFIVVAMTRLLVRGHAQEEHTLRFSPRHRLLLVEQLATFWLNCSLACAFVRA